MKKILFYFILFWSIKGEFIEIFRDLTDTTFTEYDPAI